MAAHLSTYNLQRHHLLLAAQPSKHSMFPYIRRTHTSFLVSKTVHWQCTESLCRRSRTTKNSHQSIKYSPSNSKQCELV